MWIKALRSSSLLAIAVWLSGCSGTHAPPVEPRIVPAVTASVPHDPTAFTQGLLVHGTNWLESTGGYGSSQLREVARDSGKVLRANHLPRNLFGEGLTRWQNKLYQLTWREGLCLVYDLETFQVISHFRYEGEGWGLTHCDQWLYMSNGSDIIQVRDPETFKVVRTISVHAGQGPVSGLNELEWIHEEIWANIFQTSSIAKIDPTSGRVTAFIDLDHLPPPEDRHPNQDVLNGIAYDPADDTVWITGKNWSHIYQLPSSVTASKPE